jgi:hypothetical protein
MADVLQEAYNDAIILATSANNVAADNKGFTHYFGGVKPDEQLQHFNAMMDAIINGNNNYAVEFNCVDTTNVCGPQSLMYTDPGVGEANDFKTIVVCPAFWTAISTKFLLGSPQKTSPSPPYRPRDKSSGGWCGMRREGEDLVVSAKIGDFFATAGTTVLHELTHLHALGKLIGLSADPNRLNTCGTNDY